jgi:hypothetical protein
MAKKCTYLVKMKKIAIFCTKKDFNEL